MESELRQRHINWITNAKVLGVEAGVMTVAEHNEDGSVKKEHKLPFKYSMMLPAFRGVDVTEAMLAAKLGKKRGQWDAGDVAAMTVVYTSIQRKETTVADEFAADPVGLDELIDPATGEVVA